jgi:hypothetical protein
MKSEAAAVIHLVGNPQMRRTPSKGFEVVVLRIVGFIGEALGGPNDNFPPNEADGFHILFALFVRIDHHIKNSKVVLELQDSIIGGSPLAVEVLVVCRHSTRELEDKSLLEALRASLHEGSLHIMLQLRLFALSSVFKGMDLVHLIKERVGDGRNSHGDSGSIGKQRRLVLLLDHVTTAEDRHVDCQGIDHGFVVADLDVSPHDRQDPMAVLVGILEVEHDWLVVCYGEWVRRERRPSTRTETCILPVLS